MRDNEAIFLSSYLPLAQGCPAALIQALRKLATDVKQREPGALMYLINLEAPSPLRGGLELIPKPVEPVEKAVIFMEMYRDRAALETHVNGESLLTFLEHNGHYFDPEGAKAVVASSTRHNTPLLARVCGFIRDAGVEVLNEGLLDRPARA